MSFIVLVWVSIMGESLNSIKRASNSVLLAMLKSIHIDAIKQTTNEVPLTMIANSEKMKIEKFSPTLFGLSCQFFKKSVTPFPLPIFLETLSSFQKRGRRRETILIFISKVHSYMQHGFICPTQNFMLAIIVLFVKRIMPITK